MNRRKENLSVSALYLHKRIAEGKSLPPSLQRGRSEYIKGRYWQTLNQRCVNGTSTQKTKKNSNYLKKEIMLLITKQEFDKWVDDNWDKFQELYDIGKTPSIDRKDNSIGYTIENMQVIDLKENMRKDRIKSVVGTSIFTGEVKVYPSALDAEKDGFDHKLISRACRKGMNHRGYSWKFTDERPTDQLPTQRGLGTVTGPAPQGVGPCFSFTTTSRG